MPESFRLEKSLWTTPDFEAMGWHDVRVHALAHTPETWELLFDLDYIFRWDEPEPPSEYYSFWVAPATLVFQNVSDLRIDIEPLSGFQVERVRRSEAMPMRNGFHDPSLLQRLWTIDLFNGSIEFSCTGFVQYIRQEPVHSATQHLDLQQRGGFSFARQPPVA
jgi:hypothetical protein